MIKLSNGYKFDVACASGAFGFLNGWYWEQPLRLARLLRPQEWTITIKTLSLHPIKGNLRIWWPFNLYRNCVQDFKVGEEVGTVNSVGLTNMSLPIWIKRYYPLVRGLKLNVILSVKADTVAEALEIACLLKPLKSIRGVEVNYSCPNVSHDHSIQNAVDIVRGIALCGHPLGFKVNCEDPFVEMIWAIYKYLEWVTMINTVKWPTLYPYLPSPLAPYGLIGGVSGKPIIPYARKALQKYVQSGIPVPAVSCGGIDSASEAYARFVMGARAVQIGTKIKNDPIGAQLLFDEVTKTIRKKPQPNKSR